MRDRAAAPHELDRQVERAEPVDAGRLDRLAGDRVGQEARQPVRELADRRAVRLHADGVDHRVRPPPARLLAHDRGEVVVLLEVERLARRGSRARSSRSGTRSIADHVLHAPVLGDAARHLADRPEAEHEQAAAGGHVGVGHRLPGGGQHVGEVDEAVVRRALGHLDRAVLRLRDAQVLGLAAGHLAVELRVAEQRRARAELPHLGRLALGLQARRRTCSSARRRC